MPVTLFNVASSRSSVSSPPATTVGRRIRIQRPSNLGGIIGARQRQFFVAERVVELDDLAVDADGAGNPDVLAKCPGDSFRDTALAVSGRTVKKHAAAGPQRLRDSTRELRADQQIAEGPFDVGDFRRLQRHRLRRDRRDIIRQRNGDSAKIRRVFVVAARVFRTGRRQFAHEVAHPRRIRVDDPQVTFHLGQDRLNHAEGNPHLRGDLAAACPAAVEQVFEDENRYLGFADPDLHERRRLGGNELGVPNGWLSGSAFGWRVVACR